MDRVVADARELARTLSEPMTKQIALALLADSEQGIDDVERIVRSGSPSARYQRLAGSLIRSWRNVDPALPIATLAGCLLATERTIAPADHLSLVWTGPATASSSLRRTDQALLHVIGSAQTELSIVSFVAYRVPRIREAISDAAARGVLVRIVLESPEESAGRVSHSGLDEITDPADHVSVYLWPRNHRPVDSRGNHGALHAKFAVADQSKLFISSANLTAHALTLNIEMGVLIEGGGLPGIAQALVSGLITRNELKRVFN
jgi:phosphatidylserine/phosphatidylglycerophosphate/cardiolipin synthase-like enzyme